MWGAGQRSWEQKRRHRALSQSGKRPRASQEQGGGRAPVPRAGLRRQAPQPRFWGRGQAEQGVQGALSWASSSGCSARGEDGLSVAWGGAPAHTSHRPWVVCPGKTGPQSPPPPHTHLLLYSRLLCGAEAEACALTSGLPSRTARPCCLWVREHPSLPPSLPPTTLQELGWFCINPPPPGPRCPGLRTCPGAWPKVLFSDVATSPQPPMASVSDDVSLSPLGAWKRERAAACPWHWRWVGDGPA